ncbi:MAG: GTP cyclohydrolase I FolE [Pseudomonadota bacterium]|nr:GTP cyclohydrolase I FolE [Pseudomonadota bacterium]
MSKNVSKDEALKAVKTITDEISKSSLEKEALEAVKTLILWAGDDPEREGLVDTPNRVVKAYKEFFSGYEEDPEEILSRTFEEVEGYDDAVIVRNIRVESHCEHHMVPIVGVAHIGYIPRKRVVGISKLARLVDLFGKRLQTQETMTAQIADTIDKVLQPKGVAVVIDANHQCMSTRGVHKTESSTITSRMLGTFRSDNKAREEFISLIHSPKKY